MQNFYEVNDNDLNNVTGGFFTAEQYDENGMPYRAESKMCPAWHCTCGNSSFWQSEGVSYCTFCNTHLKCGNCSSYIIAKGVCSEPLNRKK